MQVAPKSTRFVFENDGLRVHQDALEISNLADDTTARRTELGVVAQL